MPDPLLLRRLAQNSLPYRDPVAAVNWAQLTAGERWLPDAALSLDGLQAFETLPESTRRRLSQYEFFNVLCCGLWLEGLFLQRMAGRIRPGLARAEHEYLLHELREETGHSLMFLHAVEASGLPLPERAWRAPRLADVLGRYAPVHGALFWLAMFIGEDVPDRFNRHLRSLPPQDVHPVVRRICTLHVSDEARHVVHARQRLDAALAATGRAHRRVLAAAARLLLAQMVRVFYYPPAMFYELAGLSPGARWRAAALANPARRRFIAERLAPTIRTLQSYGLAVSAEAVIRES